MLSPKPGVVGSPTPLHDGYTKVTGAVEYLPDIKVHGTLHARFVTSIYPHAHLTSIHTEAALATPGVVAVLTAQDLPYVEPSNRFSLLLARDRVIFVGHPVAMVVAESDAASLDALDRVRVDYEPLPAAVTIDQAQAPNAPLVWPNGLPGTTSDEDKGDPSKLETGPSTYVKHDNVANHNMFQRGDIAKGFAAADLVVERSFNTQAVHQSYVETQGIIAKPHPNNQGITIWTSTQAIFAVRDRVAELLGIPESSVHVIGTPIGGAFGGKFPLYEGLVAQVARLVRRPVRLVLTRTEDMRATNPMMPTRTKLKVGARADGTLTAIHGQVQSDSGCLPRGLSSVMAGMIANTYRVPNIEIEASEIMTFKPSCGAYRAPGAPQAAFAIETIIDEIATTLGIDPLTLRKSNGVRPGDPMMNGDKWPNMAMPEVLDALEAHPAWRDRDNARSEGCGVGIAIAGWQGGKGASAASCTLGRDGKLSVHVGAVDMTGTSTTFALLAAEVFGIEPNDVRVVVGDSTTAPFSGASAGSKITYSVGPAVVQAAKEARKQTLEIAADEFEADVADLYIEDGSIYVRGVPNRQITLKQIGAQTMSIGSEYAPVFGQGRHANTTQAPVFCAQLAEVSIDKDTGHAIVKRLVIVQDVGRAINPLVVRGQIMGGAAQGLGWALYEDLHYDDSGQLVTGSWMDYAVPHAQQVADVIEISLVELPSEMGPFGARGVGEPPIIATAAAVANAIADATGARLQNLPMKPPSILKALNELHSNI